MAGLLDSIVAYSALTTDFFNIWNHANFGNPAFTDVEGGSFGKITSSVGTPRLIQFSLRYAF